MERKENLFKKQEVEQKIEGLIGDYPEDDMGRWIEPLPEGMRVEDVDRFIGNDGKRHWHLRPEDIQDEKERKQWDFERRSWPGIHIIESKRK